MKAAIFGAGQGGNALINLISSDYEIVACFDNNPDKWGSIVSGLSVKPPDKLLDDNPEIIWTGSLNADAAIDIENQIRGLGFGGIIKHASDFKTKYDLRLAELRLIGDEIQKRRIAGAIAELGVYQGKFARELNQNFPDRKLYLFDTFEGFKPEDIAIERGLSKAKVGDFSDTSEAAILNQMPFPGQVVILKGRFPETIPDQEIQYALVSMDADLYEPTLQGLSYFYPRLSSGGVMLIHDYNSMQFPGVKKAVDEYLNEQKLFLIPLCDFHGTAMLIKA
ncbi:TylF/MycF/NovP-related O-methyltransferase [Acetobacterium wieringae]|uniref:TylF/MycF/NovP-related O-methyltransferase n=1 Tax=Acetobacterium wieringae TaxID=52694 RepID=UPI002B21F80B|nr:TylF/MycF/NovP-related O-methyltransferase [Acetobacterium wieringae]MEA4807230.1 TylF/MycF/NovP-related O-methyltransferase [Acetobacterium wieringae]